MDKVKAAAWEASLKNTEVAGCRVESLIDYGKSAAVFKATRDGQAVALKIFDDELIERYGDKTQLARIDRELTLIGRAHSNMVKILDGGFDTATKNHFIVMEYLNGPSLSKCLAHVPDANVPSLISQLASCCEYLETLSLVHRDIKPANIVLLDNYSRLVLLDFGVIKPVGEVGLTDADGIQSFVGTLQYSSPEFLLRDEEDTIEGWRALSLYQIGGVLHDLITRRKLFEEFANPYARLVNAVQHTAPNVSSTSLPSYLVEACQAALVKDPQIRLRLVSWASFKAPATRMIGVEARERVTQRSLLGQAQSSVDQVGLSGKEDLLEAAINLLKVEARRIRGENTAAIPPLNVARVPRDGNVMVVVFRASDAHRLPLGAALEVEVQIIDANSQAVLISIAGFGTAMAAKLHNRERVPVYRGIFNPSSIGVALENAIYLVLDRAQTDGASNADALNLAELEVE